MSDADSSLRSIVFCGGGSGGHLYPAIAIMQEIELRSPECQFHFLTTGRDVEQSILSNLKCSHSAYDSVTSRDLFKNPFTAIKRLWSGYRHAIDRFSQHRPDCVIGCGGYGSVPGVLAAKRLGIPVLLLEQNLIPGRATSLLSRIACGTCVSFAETKTLLPRKACSVWTGNPVRREIAELKPDPDSKANTILILGGSQGAHAINKAMEEIITNERELFHDWFVIHQTGVTDAEAVRQAYEQAGQTARVDAYIDDMAEVYRKANLVVSRAGATSLAEISCIGLPAILVPYPHAAANHQVHNAEWYVERHAARMILQESLTSELKSVLTEVVRDETQRETMSKMMREVSLPTAAQMVVSVLLKRIAD